MYPRGVSTSKAKNPANTRSFPQVESVSFSESQSYSTYYGIGDDFDANGADFDTNYDYNVFDKSSVGLTDAEIANNSIKVSEADRLGDERMKKKYINDQFNRFMSFAEVTVDYITIEPAPHSLFRKDSGMPLIYKNGGNPYAKSKTLNIEESLRGTLYDPAMGKLDASERQCTTCAQSKCPGHNGLILYHENIMIPSPPFIRYIVKILSCVCPGCNNLIPSDEELRSVGVKYATDRVKKIFVMSKTKGACGRNLTDLCRQKRTYKSAVAAEDGVFQYYVGSDDKVVAELKGKDVYEIFSKLSEKSVIALGMKGLEKLVSLLTIGVIVPPPVNRPGHRGQDGFTHSDVTLKLEQVITASNALNQIMDSQAIGGSIVEELRSPETIAVAIQESTREYEKLASKANKTDDDRDNLQKINERIKRFKQMRQTKVQEEQQKKQQTRTARTRIRTNIPMRVGAKEGDVGESYINLYRAYKDYVAILNKEEYQGKMSTFRRKQGKTGGHTGRVVAAPAGDLELCEIEIPYFLTTKLTVGIEVTDANFIEMQKLSRDTTKVLHYTTKLDKIAIDEVSIANGLVNIKIGDKIFRRLQDGDVAVVIRMPSLHRGNMQAFFVKIGLNSMVSRTHLAVTTAYNLDHDGDELTVIIPQSPASIAEVKKRILAGRNIISPKSGLPIVGFVYNSPLGWYKATETVSYFPPDLWIEAMRKLTNRDQLSSLIHRLKLHGLVETINGREVPIMTGHTLFSMCLPENFSYPTNADSYYGVTIRNGILLKGALSSAHLDKNKPNTIIHQIAFSYGDKVASNFITDGYELAYMFLEYAPHTVSPGDCNFGGRLVPVYDGGEKDGKNVLPEDVQENHLLSRDEMEGVERLRMRVNAILQIPEDERSANDKGYLRLYEKDPYLKGNLLQVRFEKAISDVLRQSKKDKIELKLFELGPRPNGIQASKQYDVQVSNIVAKYGQLGISAFESVSRYYQNNLYSMIVSGSKGNKETVAEMDGAIGLQQSGGKALRAELQGGQRCTNTTRPGELSMVAAGYVSKSYVGSEVTGTEFFLMNWANRLPLAESATKIPEVGAMNRQAVRAADGTHVDQGATVTDTGHVFNEYYGNDGMDSRRVTKIAGKYVPVNIEMEVSILNDDMGWTRKAKGMIPITQKEPGSEIYNIDTPQTNRDVLYEVVSNNMSFLDMKAQGSERAQYLENAIEDYENEDREVFNKLRKNVYSKLSREV